MDQQLDARWRSEVQEAMRTVQRRFGISQADLTQRLSRDALITALTDAIWSQRAAYARLRGTLAVSPETADESTL
ncbi:hypothetical protein [uncultured Ralstonia sp.]|jgi:hypothetical protein|uniref:hypothetical protein n=1 Tax=uncultured Ralstonia sp. TaxID=114715 RepID=UPI001EA7C5B9|nr:hypothetical protein [uncultured Ralstonia sp.]UCF26465.1 MAG: hypothetical protein JSV72_19135 [Ralstonia sp.]